VRLRDAHRSGMSMHTTDAYAACTGQPSAHLVRRMWRECRRRRLHHRTGHAHCRRAEHGAASTAPGSPTTEHGRRRRRWTPLLDRNPLCDVYLPTGKVPMWLVKASDHAAKQSKLIACSNHLRETSAVPCLETQTSAEDHSANSCHSSVMRGGQAQGCAGRAPRQVRGRKGVLDSPIRCAAVRRLEAAAAALACLA
jgi:hypothetical protein